MTLHNRVALITGGGSGIGRSIALLFAAQGAAVAVADLRLERAEQVRAEIQAAGGNALALSGDVSQALQVAALTTRTEAELGPVDILVNNAAIAQGDDITTFDEATWDLNLNVVLKSVFLCSKAVLPGMMARRRGAIVNISSVNGLTGLGEEAYAAAKAGVINLTQNMAVKYGPYQVRCNVICPGTIQTPIWNERLAAQPDIFDRLARYYPLGRVGQPEDIAQAALFLASDAAAWITGTVLTVDGGLMAGRYAMAQELSTMEVKG